MPHFVLFDLKKVLFRENVLILSYESINSIYNSTHTNNSFSIVSSLWDFGSIIATRLPETR